MSNTVGPDISWRLVHDGTDVLACFESVGYTESINTIFESSSKAGVDAEIARLNLKVEPGLLHGLVPGNGTVTPLEFMDKFSESAQLRVVTAAQANPAVKLWYDRLLATAEISLSSLRVIAGLEAMIDAGVITADEARQALS